MHDYEPGKAKTKAARPISDEAKAALVDLAAKVDWLTAKALERTIGRPLTALDKAELDLATIRARKIAGDYQADLTVARERIASLRERALEAQLNEARTVCETLQRVLPPWADAPGSVHQAIVDLGRVLS